MRLALPLFAFCLWAALPAQSAPAEPRAAQKQDLEAIQQEVKRLEGGIKSDAKAQATLTQELQRLEKLLRLQALEIQLSTIELEKLEEKVQEMMLRKDSLEASINKRKERLREMLSVLPSLETKSPLTNLSEGVNTYLSMYRETVDKLLSMDKKEIVALKEILAEVQRLNQTLLEEKERGLAHAEDLKEKQAILALNQNLKRDLLKKTKVEQAQKLKAYHSAKAAESELESLLNKFQVASEIRKKSEPKIADESLAKAQLNPNAAFITRKGSLLPPVNGKLINSFGRRYDSLTSLYTFHKGVDIDAGPSVAVKSVAKGKVVFSGELGAYGKLLIVDHGDQFFSLVGHLGEVSKKEGDEVQEGESIAKTSPSKPLYFEIRQRHVAINPVPWFAANSLSQ